jgi:HSP20 family molecular chaperone IbpA
LVKKKLSTESKPADDEEEVKTVVTPEVCIDHDETAYSIEVELPGVMKPNVDLSLSEQSFCVEASRDDVVYLGCFTLAHKIDENQARAKFVDGLLKIEVPLKAPIQGKRIKIE